MLLQASSNRKICWVFALSGSQISAAWCFLVVLAFFPHFHLTRAILDTHFLNHNAFFSRFAKAERLLTQHPPQALPSSPSAESHSFIASSGKACESCDLHVTRPARRLWAVNHFADLTPHKSELGAECQPGSWPVQGSNPWPPCPKRPLGDQNTMEAVEAAAAAAAAASRSDYDSLCHSKAAWLRSFHYLRLILALSTAWLTIDKPISNPPAFPPMCQY